MRSVIAGFVVLLLAVPAAEATKPKPKDVNAVADHERDSAILKGLRYLEETVFQLPDASGTPRKQFTVAVTGLVNLLARDGKGRRSDGSKSTVDKARAYLAKYVSGVAARAADSANWPQKNGSFSSNDLIQYTWPLAMAAVFQGELHGRGLNRGDAKKQAARIVELLGDAQASNGGWGHGKVRELGAPRGPNPMDGFGGYPDTLVASSNLVASALGLVHRFAPPKTKDGLDKARAYYRYAGLPNGNFPYDPSQRSAHKSMNGVSRAAGAALAMHVLGIPWKDKAMARTTAFIDENFEYLPEGHGSSTYNLALAALLQQARGPRHWKRFKAAFFRRLLDKQAKDGSFECICEGKAFGATNDSNPMGGVMKKAGSGFGGMFGKSTAAYVTSLHTLILLLDRTTPRLLDKHKPPAPSKPTTPTTPR